MTNDDHDTVSIMKVGDLVRNVGTVPTDGPNLGATGRMGIALEIDVDEDMGFTGNSTIVKVFYHDDYGTYWTIPRNLEIVSA